MVSGYHNVHFPLIVNFILSLSISTKRGTGFIGIILDLETGLGRIGILATVSLLIHFHGVSFHLCVPSLISLKMFCSFQCTL